MWKTFLVFPVGLGSPCRKSGRLRSVLVAAGAGVVAAAAAAVFSAATAVVAVVAPADAYA